MKVLIVEDVTLVAERIASLAQKHLSGCQTRVSYTLEAAKICIAEDAFDLVFLDLNLNGQDGFELLKLTAAASFYTIVITANQDQAIRGFDMGVFDFITKPILESRFQLAVERFLDNTTIAKPKVNQLAIKSRGKIRLISMTSIAYIKGAGNYAEVYTNDGKKYLSDKNLDKLSLHYSSYFIRVHRSFLVPKDGIAQVLKHGGGKYSVMLTDGVEVPLSRAVYQEKFKADRDSDF